MDLPESTDHATRLRKACVLGLAVLLEVLVFWVDHATSPLLSFTPFYFLPIGLAAWHVGAWAGYALAVLAGLARIHVFGALYPNDSYLMYAYDTAINTLVFGAFTYLVVRVHGLIETLTEQTQTDVLTGLRNRRYFFEAGTVELARAFRHKYPVSIAYIDVNDFKKLNDENGHAAGDPLLADIAECLSLDLRDGDLLARLGGDEFALLLPYADQENTRRALSRIEANLADMMAQGEPKVTLSIGAITYLADNPVLFDELLQAADALMYRAKNAGNTEMQLAVFKPDAAT